MNKFETFEALTCDRNWPVCLFDFTYKNKIPEYFIYCVDSSSYRIQDDYI
jgi:hypothetical protein